MQTYVWFPIAATQIFSSRCNIKQYFILNDTEGFYAPSLYYMSNDESSIEKVWCKVALT